MEPSIRTLAATKLIGEKIVMSYSNNRTQALWQSFMPKRRQISNSVNTDLYSVEIYDDTQFLEHFDPHRNFEKWAAVPVDDFTSVPSGMETLEIPEGLYAVFFYRGRASEAAETYRYIYGSWLPGSVYKLDDRPHFALMGEKYKNDSPDSEEEFWIPIKKR